MDLANNCNSKKSDGDISDAVKAIKHQCHGIAHYCNRDTCAAIDHRENYGKLQYEKFAFVTYTLVCRLAYHDTDRKLLFARPLVLSAARAGENWFVVSPSMARPYQMECAVARDNGCLSPAAHAPDRDRAPSRNRNCSCVGRPPVCRFTESPTPYPCWRLNSGPDARLTGRPDVQCR